MFRREALPSAKLANVVFLRTPSLKPLAKQAYKRIAALRPYILRVPVPATPEMQLIVVSRMILAAGELAAQLRARPEPATPDAFRDHLEALQHRLEAAVAVDEPDALVFPVVDPRYAGATPSSPSPAA